jgi:hypothetical protein
MDAHLKHLERRRPNLLALRLSDDVYGGDLDDQQIKRRLIEEIHLRTDHEYAATDMMPVWHTADLIRSVWEYMDNRLMEVLSWGGDPPPLPETLEEAIADEVSAV